MLILRCARPDCGKVSHLVFWGIHRRLQNKRKIGQLRACEDDPETCKPDGSVSDVLMPVFPAAQLPFGIVGMDDRDAVDADIARGLIDRGP
jgi:hypothetical protein